MGIKVEIIDNGRKVKLLEDIPFITVGLIADVVPAGFISDLASVPRFFRRMFPKMDAHYKAAIIHDYLCEYPHITTKEDADETFLRFMERDNVPWWKRKAMYWGVRLYSPFRKGKA